MKGLPSAAPNFARMVVGAQREPREEAKVVGLDWELR